MLTNKEDIKNILGVEDSSQDVLIENLVEEVDNIIKTYCGRKFEKADYTYTAFSNDLENPIFLTETPIDTINSITLNDEEQDIDYTLNKKSGVLYLYFLPSTVMYNRIVKINYTGGYDNIPAGLVSIAKEYIVFKYYQSGNNNSIVQEKIDSLSVKYDINNFENSINKKLDMYKKVSL